MDLAKTEIQGDSQVIQKSSKIDPFIIDLPDNWSDTIKKIKDVLNISITVEILGNKLKLHTKSVDEFQILQRYFDENNTNYYCLDPVDSRHRKIVTRELPSSTPESDIIQYLADEGFKAKSAHYITSRNYCKPLPLFVSDNPF